MKLEEIKNHFLLFQHFRNPKYFQKFIRLNKASGSSKSMLN